MMDISEKIINHKIKSIQHNYIDQSLKIYFESGSAIIFGDCAMVFDLGIVGHVVSYVSLTGTLGMTLELKRINKDPDEYSFIIISRDIKDIHNKNELVISYKKIEFENSI